MNLQIPFVKDMDDPLQASLVLDTLERNAIANTPWPQFKNRPEASFSICYTDECILLKFYVQETSFRAFYKTPNILFIKIAAWNSL